MKNKFKLFMTSSAIAMALFLPLQLQSLADTNTTLNNDISALTKEPVSKKKIAYKFLMAMLGVATSSIVIYVGLSVYNKIFKESSDTIVGLNSLNNSPPKSCNNFKDAINIFLEKTNWD